MSTVATSLESSGQIRHLAANTTSNAWALAEGRTLTKPSDMIPLGSGSKRIRALQITPFGQGADNSTFEMRFYGVNVGYADVGGDILDYELTLILSVVATLGTSFGVLPAGQQGITTADRIADTVVPTEAAYLASVRAGYTNRAPFAFSPATNTLSRIVIPELTNFEFLVPEYNRGSSATNCNLLWQRDT